MKTGTPGMPVAEYDRVGLGPSVDSSSNAAHSSTPSGTSGDHQMIDVSLDAETQTIPDQTPAWPPDTDEYMTFSSESGKFLSGPGVIPAQGAIPMPQAVGHEQDTQTPRFEQVSFDDRQLGTIDQPSLEEQGDLSTRTLTHATEHQDDIPGAPTHEENLNVVQYQEPSVSIALPTSDQPATSLTLAEARLKFKLEPNMTLSQDPDGKLVIQELDSPVTRREKAMRRKRARSQVETPVIAACSALEDSDLSSLSELSEDDDGNVHIKKKIDKTKKTRATQPGQVVLEDDKMLDGGTLGKYDCLHMRITADFRT